MKMRRMAFLKAPAVSKERPRVGRFGPALLARWLLQAAIPRALFFTALSSGLLGACSSSAPPGSSSLRAPSAQRSGSLPSARNSAPGASAPAGVSVCRAVAALQAGSTLPAANSAASTQRAAFEKFKAEEPTILAVVPPAIKGDFETAFTVYNKLFEDLASVGYDSSKLPTSDAKSLAASSAQLATAEKAIQEYVATACAAPTTRPRTPPSGP